VPLDEQVFPVEASKSGLFQSIKEAIDPQKPYFIGALLGIDAKREPMMVAVLEEENQ
jgi:hypothetical protein